MSSLYADGLEWARVVERHEQLAQAGLSTTLTALRPDVDDDGDTIVRSVN